jgi:hypothetical protein
MGGLELVGHMGSIITYTCSPNMWHVDGLIVSLWEIKYNDHKISLNSSA